MSPDFFVSYLPERSIAQPYPRRSRQSQIPKAPKTMTAKMLTQSGMLTPPAVTSTRKRTRSNCARAISQKRIAATIDACFFISALLPHRWPRPSYLPVPGEVSKMCSVNSSVDARPRLESDPDDPLLKLNCTPNSTAQYRGMRTGADAYPPSGQASRAALVDRSNRFRYAPRPCHDHRETARWAPIIAN
jgi:hypothetical protein